MNRPRRVPRALASALPLFLALVLAPPFLASEGAGNAAAKGATELRAIIGGIATVSADNAEGSSLSIGYDESLALLMPKDSPFVQGVEIEIKSPRVAMAAPGGFAYELWRRVEPDPDRKRVAYRGERIIMQPLPARAGYAIRVPIRADHSIKPSPYAVLLPFIVAREDFPFLLKLVPVSKALSPEAEAAKFRITVRPLLTEEGALSLKFRYPDAQGERAPLSVTIDDRKVDPSAPISLKAGSYRLGVASEAYRDESRIVVVEQGKTTELVVELQDTKPVLTIEAPDSALITLDGRRVEQAERAGMGIEPGEHSATCRIGDYTLTRKFTASRGKPYKLVLDIDLRVEEAQ
jgi:hypothetical protein